jgi:hypothetical protein
MLNFLIGVVLGWFAHLHYGELVMKTIKQVIGDL